MPRYKNTLLLLIVLGTLSFLGCGGSSSSSSSSNTTGAAPTAAFTFAPSAPMTGQTVSFTDTFTDSPFSWSWSFGDGATSTIQNPTHVYRTTGSFIVTLVASHAEGDSGSTQTLTVSRPSSAPWRFAVLADTHVPIGDFVGAMVSSMVSDRVKLVLFPGDLVTAGSSSNKVLSQLSAWKSAVAPLYRAGIGVYPVRGNHEAAVPDSISVWNSAFSGSFALPANGPSDAKNLSYSFMYKNALFVGLDEYIHRYQRVNQDWLNQQLADNTTHPHVFVFGHEPAFKAYHPLVLDFYPSKRDAFWASLVAAGARTYFCGHDHFFDVARIDDGDGNADNDLYQVIVGTGGGPLVDTYAYDGFNSSYTPIGLEHVEDYGYLLVEISGETDSDLGVTLMFKQRTYDPVSASDIYTTTYTLSYTADTKLK